MPKLKLMTILGTRPELIRLSAVIKCADNYFEHILVHTGQNWDYELFQVFLDDLHIRTPDYMLECGGGSLGQTMGDIIAKSYDIMEKEKPDAVLILGDTNSALSAISAKRLKIPIFHMEAGNRCWDMRVPEMINRKIVDHISDINLPYTEHARRHLLSEGIDGKTVFTVGSPMNEVINSNMEGIKKSRCLDNLGITPNGYFLVSAHREENIEDEEIFLSLMTSLNMIADEYGLPVIYSTHPRARKAIETRGFEFNPLVRPLAPFGFSDYIKLQTEAFCVLSDSGTLSEESAMLHFPAVQLRTSTERPETIETGSVVIAGVKPSDILQALKLTIDMFDGSAPIELPEDYKVMNVSEKVVKIIQSYTKIVNLTTWRK